MVYVLWEVRSPGSSCMLTGEIFTDLGGPWRLRGPGPPAAAILCIAAPPISIALPALRTSLDDFRAILRPSCQVRPSAVLTFLYRIWLKSRPRRSNRLSLPSRSSPPRESSTRETNRKPLLFFFFFYKVTTFDSLVERHTNSFENEYFQSALESKVFGRIGCVLTKFSSVSFASGPLSPIQQRRPVGNCTCQSRQIFVVSLSSISTGYRQNPPRNNRSSSWNSWNFTLLAVSRTLVIARIPSQPCWSWNFVFTATRPRNERIESGLYGFSEKIRIRSDSSPEPTPFCDLPGERRPLHLTLVDICPRFSRKRLLLLPRSTDVIGTNYFSR